MIDSLLVLYIVTIILIYIIYAVLFGITPPRLIDSLKSKDKLTFRIMIYSVLPGVNIIMLFGLIYFKYNLPDD